MEGIIAKNNNPLGMFNTWTLKIIACVSMLIDHIGVEFFPQIVIFRIIGRLAFPLFAFFIAEGCRYTRNPVKRLALILIVGVGCNAAYYIVSREQNFNILITFTLSILLIYCLSWTKKILFNEKSAVSDKVISVLFFVAAVYLVYIATQAVLMDYSFSGVMTPVLVSLFDFHDVKVPDKLKALDCLGMRILCLGICLLWIWADVGSYIQAFAIAALPLLMMYNGEKGGGKYSKYFFYIFYPLHLLLIGIVSIII